MEDDIRNILFDWSDVKIQKFPAFWVLSGSYKGKSHAGWRDDPISLAHDLAKTAREMHKPPPAPLEPIVAPVVVVDPRDAEIARLRAQLAEATKPPEPEPIVHVEEVEDAEPYVPNFQLIPDKLARFAEADETAEDFRNRLKRLWQRFGIEDGHNFPGGGEALTGDEKITMREIDIVLNSDEGKDAGLLEWLLAEES